MNTVEASRPEGRAAETGRPATGLLLACGLAGPPLFVLVFLIEGATRPGYNPWHNFVSALSLGDRGWVQIANFLASGLLTLCFAAGLRRLLRPSRASFWGSLLFGALGAAMITAGLFVTDPSLGYPPGAPAWVPPTPHGTIHNVAGYTIFIALSAAAFLLARPFARLAAGRAWATYSRATGLLVALCFVAGQVVAGLEQGGSLAWTPAGLLQRSAIILGSLWSTLLAARLLRVTTRQAKHARVSEGIAEGTLGTGR